MGLIDDWTVSEIKDAISACERVADVNDTAIHYQKHIAELEKSPDQYHRTMAIQIKNLARYQRRKINEGW